MATGFNTSGLTLNPQEVQLASEFLMLATVEAPDINTVHTVFEGIVMKEQIVLAGQLGLTGVEKTACGLTDGGQSITLTQKYWEPSLVETVLKICALELDPLLKAYRNLIKKYDDNFDSGYSDLGKMLSIRLAQAIKKSIWRIVWHGNKSIPTAGVGSAGLINSANAKYFNMVNGIFYQLLNGSYANIDITENAQTTKELQLTFADGAAEAYFKAIYAKAPRELRNSTNGMMLVSHALWQNYHDGLVNTGKAFDITLVENGLRALTWNGIPVVDMDVAWDDINQSYFAQTSADLAYDNPNRIVYTVPENIPIGVTAQSDLGAIENWYEKKDQTHYFVNGFSIDAKVLDANLIVYGI